MGSEAALTTSTRHLDLAGYKNYSARSQATFASQREDVYDLFKQYVKMKGQRDEFDTADRYRLTILKNRGTVS